MARVAAPGPQWLASARQRWHDVVEAPVDCASLAVFRMLFGVTMAAAALRFLARGWATELYVLPTYHFTWALFPWVRPLPAGLMPLHFVVLAILACGIAIGFQYRFCAALFFVGFTYVELIDKTAYLNHYYLVSLLSALLVVVPAHRIWSVDARRRQASTDHTAPAWTLNIVRFQIAVVYVFAGLAKLNADWLLEAQPLRIWLAARSDLPIVGSLLALQPVAYAFSWGGALFDLTIVLFLLRRRTRFIAYLAVIVFHAMTALLFPIGMFPWLMIISAPIFFSPDWPRRWIAERWGGGQSGVGADDLKRRTVPVGMIAALAVYALIQIAIPLRAYWPGTQSEWTYRGFNFAWRVMLIEKSGYTELVAYDPASGARRPIRLRDYITERQEKMMAQDPFMIRALARHIGEDLRARGQTGIEVRADSFAAVNGHELQRLIDPQVDLSGRETSTWIVPLEQRVTSYRSTLRTRREDSELRDRPRP